jgi:antitoxin (DNA-binding transcriptional repressor) of toxin-antitoxin stability system
MVDNIVMIRASIVEVKAKLSDYLERAAHGEHVLICRHNKPVAELRAVTEVRTEPRPIGPLPGRPRFDVPPSFFEPLATDEVAQWEGTASSDPLSSQWVAPDGQGALAVAEKGPRYWPARRRSPARKTRPAQKKR